jgi:hypothetical protein
MLFGGGEDEDAAFYQQRSRPASRGTVLASAGEDSGTRGLFSFLKPQQAEPTTGGLLGGRRASPDEELAPGFEAREGSGSMLQPAPSTQIAAAPVPPRRPEDVGPLLAEAPTPPVRPVLLASLGGSAPVVATDLKGQMRSSNTASARVASADERQALRALFEAAVTPTSETRHPATSRSRPQPLAQAGPIMAPASNVRMVFSSVSAGELSPNRFSGPAVAPLPRLR